MQQGRPLVCPRSCGIAAPLQDILEHRLLLLGALLVLALPVDEAPATVDGASGGLLPRTLKDKRASHRTLGTTVKEVLGNTWRGWPARGGKVKGCAGDR